MKRGISLIAVLMFMLAATTASIVIFKWIGSENFSSGARLKASEAYQASQSGLDAVQAWLSNKALDVGALIGQYYDSPSPIFIPDTVLGKICNSNIDCKQQNYKVYLIGIDTTKSPIRLKFMSVGRARDSSKISQTAIFSTDGLYRVFAQSKTPSTDCELDFSQAFFGGISGNTQAQWSSAIVNGDLNIGNEIKLKKRLIVTGNVSGDQAINSCEAGHGDSADIYIVGDVNTTRLNVCGNLYVGGVIGGNKISGNTWEISKDLYVAGGIKRIQQSDNQPKMEIGKSLTSCGDIIFSGTVDKFTVKGDVLMDTCSHLQPTQPINPKQKVSPKVEFSNPTLNGDVILGEGKFWSVGNITGNVSCNKLNIGNNGMYFPGYNNVINSGITCRINPNGNSNQDSIRFIKTTTNLPQQNNASNKPKGANELIEMSNKIDFTKNPPRVPDPLALPIDTKAEWTGLAKKLLDSANRTDVESGSYLPDACIYLLRDTTKYEKDQNYYCKSKFGGCGGNTASYLNSCYAQLKAKDCNSSTPKFLYRGSGEECYLPIEVKSITDVDTVNGNFIWIFKPKPSTLKLPATTDASKIFVYLPLGAGEWQANNKGNYFIFADANIDDASGNATIHGTVFLANGATIGKLPDTKLIFNEVLFKSLVEAGILASTDDPSQSRCRPNIVKVDDDIWISASNKLSVKLESKEISKESEPKEDPKLKPSILVMPRVVRLTPTNESCKNYLPKFYEYLPLNGATLLPSEVLILNSALNCNCTNLNAKGEYNCNFPSRSDVSPFHVIVGTNN